MHENLRKALSHKYVRKVPTGNPKDPWRYFYAGDEITHEQAHAHARAGIPMEEETDDKARAGKDADLEFRNLPSGHAFAHDGYSVHHGDKDLGFVRRMSGKKLHSWEAHREGKVVSGGYKSRDAAAADLKTKVPSLKLEHPTAEQEREREHEAKQKAKPKPEQPALEFGKKKTAAEIADAERRTKIALELEGGPTKQMGLFGGGGAGASRSTTTGQQQGLFWGKDTKLGKSVKGFWRSRWRPSYLG